MAKVKIYDGSKWVTPSEVNANPTLAGTETELTGLEIDGVKYKVPVGGGGSATGDGALYKHVITFPDSNDEECVFTFLSKYSDVFVNGGTPQDFLLAINAKDDDTIIISPMLKKDSTAEIVNSIAVNTNAYAVEFKTASGSTFLSVFYDDLVDTVSTYIAGGSGGGSGGSGAGTQTIHSNAVFVKIDSISNTDPDPISFIIQRSRLDEVLTLLSSALGMSLTAETLPQVWANANEYEKREFLSYLNGVSTAAKMYGKPVVNIQFDSTTVDGQDVKTAAYICLAWTTDSQGVSSFTKKLDYTLEEADNIDNSTLTIDLGEQTIQGGSGGTVEAEPIISIKMEYAVGVDSSGYDAKDVRLLQFYCSKERWDSFVALAKQQFDIDITYSNFGTFFKATNQQIQDFTLGYLLYDYKNGKTLPKAFLQVNVSQGSNYPQKGDFISEYISIYYNGIELLGVVFWGDITLPNSFDGSTLYTTANTVITVEEIAGAAVGSSAGGSIDTSNLQVGHLSFNNNKSNGIKSLGSIWSVLSLTFETQYESYTFWAKYMCSEEEMYDLMNQVLDTYRQQGLTIPTVTDNATLTNAFNIVVDTLFALDSSSAGPQLAGAIVGLFAPSVYGPIQSFMKDSGTTLFTIFRTGDDFGMYAIGSQGNINIHQTLITDIGTTKPTNLSVWIND